ncbi:FGGY family carbohydrate kinase [Oscillospiraceae bacterium PP1C4]
MRYIGIDIGSSFVKAAVFDLESHQIVCSSKWPSAGRLSDPDPRKFEIRVGDFVNTVRDTIYEAVKNTGKLDGILLSTQMHGFVYSTRGREDRYVSWQDCRCVNPLPGTRQSAMEYLKEQFLPSDMEKCGTYLKPSLGMCNLYALLQSNQTISDDGELYTLGSYVISSLTGNNICHASNAAPLGLFDVVAHQWSKGIIEKAGFGKIKLPKIAQSDFEVCGYYRCCGQEIPVYPDYGDQQTAILGCLSQDADMVVNIATASQLSVTTAKFTPGDYEIRPYFENKYINTISNMPGGRNLAVLTDFLGEICEQIGGCEVTTSQVWNAVLKEFEPDSQGLRIDTDFYATPASVDGGSISGITPANLSIRSLFTAAFEDMAEKYSRGIRTLLGDDSTKGRLVFSGGVSWKTPQLLELVSRTTGIPYTLSSIPDEVFHGLFRIALVCAGICRSLDDKPETDDQTEIETRRNHVI